MTELARKWIVRSLGLPGSWSWACRQMAAGHKVYRTTDTGTCRYRIDLNGQGRIEWSWGPRSGWQNAFIFLKDFDCVDWAVKFEEPNTMTDLTPERVAGLRRRCAFDSPIEPQPVRLTFEERGRADAVGTSIYEDDVAGEYAHEIIANRATIISLLDALDAAEAERDRAHQICDSLTKRLEKVVAERDHMELNMLEVPDLDHPLESRDRRKWRSIKPDPHSLQEYIWELSAAYWRVRDALLNIRCGGVAELEDKSDE